MSKAGLTPRPGADPTESYNRTGQRFSFANMIMMNKKIIAIVGPTASGKTGIGVRLAKQFNGEIISADSRQVFRGLDLGTGKDGAPCHLSNINNQLSSNDQVNKKLIDHCNLKLDSYAARCRCIDSIPQWLIDIKEPGEKFTLFDWLPLARLVIDDIFARGKTPIIVGGTGLYVQALAEGFELTRIGNKESGIREVDQKQFNNLTPLRPPFARATEVAQQGYEGQAIEQLQELLKEIAPKEYEKVDTKNPHRLIRAIEKARANLKPAKKKPDFEVLQIVIDLPREELYKKIDKRVEERFRQGMLEEVIELLMQGVRIEWMERIGLEYRIIGGFIWRQSPAFINRIRNKELGIRDNSQKNQEYSPSSLFEIPNSLLPSLADFLRSLPEYQEMKQELKYKIHAFARRQLTWFRRFPEIKWLGTYKEIKGEVKNFLDK